MEVFQLLVWESEVLSLSRERGRGGGNQIRYAVDTSWDAVDTRCLAGQVNYTIAQRYTQYD